MSFYSRSIDGNDGMRGALVRIKPAETETAAISTTHSASGNPQPVPTSPALVRAPSEHRPRRRDVPLSPPHGRGRLAADTLAVSVSQRSLNTWGNSAASQFTIISGLVFFFF